LPGLGPGIHVVNEPSDVQDVGARNKSGHGELS
jgi:hypothetical protein